MRVGNDVRISDKAEIKRPELMIIGNHVSIESWVYISVKATLGDYIHICSHVCIIGGASSELIMEDFTNISAGGKIVCCSDDFTQGLINPIVPVQYRHLINKPVIFKRFSVIGVNSVVLPGVTLAEGSSVGAGSVVTKDTLPWMVYCGIPAVPIFQRKKELILKGAKELGYDV